MLGNFRANENRSKTKSFTLLELMVCLSVIAVLGIIVVPRYYDCFIRVKIASIQEKGKLISQSLQQFLLDNPHYNENKRHSNVASDGSGNVLFCNVHEAPCYFQHLIPDHLSPDFFHDPFLDEVFGLSYLVSAMKQEIHGIFPCKEGNQSGSMIISRGPDQNIEQISPSIVYYGIQYAVTNGIRSTGDIFVTIPEISYPTFLLYQQR